MKLVEILQAVQYHSNTWHDTFAKVEILGDRKTKKPGTMCKKKKIKRFENYLED